MRFEGRSDNQTGDVRLQMVRRGERFEVVRDIQTVRLSDIRLQTVRRQTDIAAGNVAPTYGRQHSAGGFLDSARNDRGERFEI